MTEAAFSAPVDDVHAQAKVYLPDGCHRITASLSTALPGRVEGTEKADGGSQTRISKLVR